MNESNLLVSLELA